MYIVKQDDLKSSDYWRRFVSGGSYRMETNSADRVEEGEDLVAMDEVPSRVRKPYTITKQREKWTEEEHQKFLEALKLYGRAWRHIEAHIGTKSAVQIRSHAQKFFSKLEKEASTGILAMMDQDLKIPPPRPKRKPGHPYPRKAEVLVRAGGFLIADEETHIESCEISTVSTGSQRDHYETAEYSEHASNSKPLNKQNMMQGLSQPSQMATSLKLFGQTFLVQDLCTDDTLWSSEKKGAMYSKGLSKYRGGTFQSAPCQEDISYCRKIRNQTFLPGVSEIDTFQSGGSSAGSDTIHKSSDVANEQCSDALLNSGHSSLSKEEKIRSTPRIKRFSRNYEEQNDNVQHWKKSQDSYTKRHRYFQKSHEEYERHNSEVQMAFEALHQGLSSPNAKEMCFSVSDHCKILEHCRKRVLQNETAIPLKDNISYNRLASESNRSFSDLNRAQCSKAVYRPEMNMDSLRTGAVPSNDICENIDVEMWGGVFLRCQGSNLHSEKNGWNRR